MRCWSDLFTPRQLTVLCAFSDLVAEARRRVRADACAAGLPDDGVPLCEGGVGASAYAEAVSVYLEFIVSKCADYWSTICTWDRVGEKMGHTFTQQTLQMSWDYAEANPFSSSTGNWLSMVNRVAEALGRLPAERPGTAVRQNAATVNAAGVMVSTDPPYYDNIGYADLSDFFYVWLRRSLAAVFPDVCSTILTPKSQELIAVPHRHGGDKQASNAFFKQGLGQAFMRLRAAHDGDFPMTVYYAFKQAETSRGGTSSTEWKTMLAALIAAGWTITGSWPMRTERSNRTRSLGSNALASSIVLVCRPRPADAPPVSKRDFLQRLRHRLPDALKLMRQGWDRSRGSGAGGYRPRYGDILALFACGGSRRYTDGRTGCAVRDQPGAG